jgi:hypothetical protein
VAIKIARLNFLGTPPSSRYDSGEIDFLPEIAPMSAKRNLLLGIVALQNGGTEKAAGKGGRNLLGAPIDLSLLAPLPAFKMRRRS